MHYRSQLAIIKSRGCHSHLAKRSTAWFENTTPLGRTHPSVGRLFPLVRAFQSFRTTRSMLSKFTVYVRHINSSNCARRGHAAVCSQGSDSETSLTVSKCPVQYPVSKRISSVRFHSRTSNKELEKELTGLQTFILRELKSQRSPKPMVVVDIYHAGERQTKITSTSLAMDPESSLGSSMLNTCGGERAHPVSLCTLRYS